MSDNIRNGSEGEQAQSDGDGAKDTTITGKGKIDKECWMDTKVEEGERG